MENDKAMVDGLPVADAGGGLTGLPDAAMIDLKALADALGCCGRTVRRMIRSGELPPPITLGRRKVWTAGRVRAWLERRADEAEKRAERDRAKIRALNP